MVSFCHFLSRFKFGTARSKKDKCLEETILKGEYPHFYTKGGGGGLQTLFLEIAL